MSIEIVAGPGGRGGGANTRWFKIISVQGFPSMVAGEPYRKRIVQIGHLHPDFKKYKKVWDDAFSFACDDGGEQVIGGGCINVESGRSCPYDDPRLPSGAAALRFPLELKGTPCKHIPANGATSRRAFT